MSIQMANLIVWLFTAYGVLGVLFAIPFLMVGINRMDSRTKGAGLAFRLIVFPGVVALWPLLLHRTWRGGPAK